MRSALKGLSWTFVTAYLISGCVRAWFNPSGAHGLRQVETLGLSAALNSDFTRKGWGALWDGLLYPKVLQRGLSSGINASEFPLLNLLSLPFFQFGPHAGALMNTILILLLNFAAAIFFIPKLLRRFEVAIPDWLVPLLYLSIVSVSFQASIPMPEGLALPLLLIGMTLRIQTPRKPRHGALGLLLMSLAIAVKPTAVIGLLPLVLLYLRERRRVEWLDFAWILVFPAWWYGIHAHEILRRVDGIQVFAVARIQPLQNFRDVGPNGVLQLLLRQISKEQFPFLMGLGWFALACFLPRARIWALALVIALLGAISLDGMHIFPHFYYFFGANAVSMVLMAVVLTELGLHNTQVTKWGYRFALITIFWGTLYGIRGNVWQIARTPDTWTAVAPIREALPADYHLLADDEVDATKLMFMGRPGTMAGRAITELCHDPAYHNLRLAMVIEEQNYLGWKHPGDCFSSARLAVQVDRPGVNWLLFLH